MDHESHLERITNTPNLIGEDRNNIKIILIEPIWSPYEKGRVKMCDRLFINMLNDGMPMELKRSKNKREYALQQMEYGRAFLHLVMGLDVPFGKFVVYHESSDRYYWEKVYFNKHDRLDMLI